MIPERTHFPIHKGFSLGLGMSITIHHGQPILTYFLVTLKAEAKAVQGKSSSCELVAALCSMLDLWDE